MMMSRMRERRKRRRFDGTNEDYLRQKLQDHQILLTTLPPQLRRASRDPGPVAGSGLLALLLSLQILLLSISVVPLVRSQQVYYYATLPKVGHIRGLQISDEANQAPVAAFLGVPYAAAPTGLLRFMPAGAANSANQRALEQCQLAPGGQQRVGARPHTHFGRQCVHLSDWLDEPDEKSQETSSTSPRGSSTKSRSHATTNETLLAIRMRQSEDCLNFNAFIPINESSANNKGSNDKQSMRHQQIKSNYPSQPTASGQQQGWPNSTDNQISTNRISDTQQADLVNQETQKSASNNNKPPVLIWPLPKEEARLPVLVVIHGMATTTTSSKQNSFSYLNLARRTNSLVITFNYRKGLLGFLPYSMDEGFTSSPSASPTSSSSRWLPRNNHAIWDQIGLLHWLNRNVAYLNGDPRNVTLVAAENQANQFAQLLTMSPLAKGLFNRVVLVHDESNAAGHQDHHHSPAPIGQAAYLMNLLAKINEARDLRRQLNSALNRIVQQIAPEVASGDERQALEFVQAANLAQLAKIELQLQLLNSGRLLALAMGPSLDDKLLFPQLSSLALHHQTTVQSSIESFGAQLKYCHYMRQLYANKPDPLNLLASEGGGGYDNGEWMQIKQSSSSTTESNWYRHANAERPTVPLNSSGSSSQLTAASNFEHLYKLQLLARLLGLVNGYGGEGPPAVYRSGVDVEDEEEDDDFGELSRRQQGRAVLAAHGTATLRRRRDTDSTAHMTVGKRSTSDPSEDLSQLMELIASFDLMVGYFTNGSSQTDPFDGLVGKNFANISGALLRMWYSFGSRPIIELMNFVDLHHISTLLTPHDMASAQYCDLFSPHKSNKSSFVFILVLKDNLDEHSEVYGRRQEISWLIDTVEQVPSITDGLTNFIRFGDPNHQKSQSMDANFVGRHWPAYDLLNRRIKRPQYFMPTNKSSDQNSNSIRTVINNNKLKNQLAIYLDLVPYFNQLARNKTSPTGQQSDSEFDLVACIKQLDEIIGRSSPPSVIAHNSSLVEIEATKQQSTASLMGESRAQCLFDCIARFRGLVRQNAVDDLEPINRLRAARWPSPAANSSRSIIIATRNLVSTDSAGDIQQLDQPVTSSHTVYVEPPMLSTHKPPTFGLANPGATSGRGSDSMSGGFFTRLYRNAAGQALALVVGCGLLVFLVNLGIVVIITLRASRTRRRRVSGSSRNDEERAGFPVTVLGQTQRQQQQLTTEQHQQSKVAGSLKRSSLKKYNGESCQLAQSASRLNGWASRIQVDQHEPHSTATCTMKAKQLKFDLSGVESTRLTENSTGSGEDMIYDEQKDSFDHNDHNCHTDQKLGFQKPIMLVASSSDLCVNDNEDTMMVNGIVHGKIYAADYQDNQLLTMGNCDQVQQTFQELQPEKLADSGWQDNSEPIYLKHQHHLHHPHNHNHYQQQQLRPCSGGGVGLNSPAFGSQSTTTSTNSHHHNYPRHQSIGDDQQQYFVTQTSPDNSATLSVTPIRLESFSNAMPISPIEQQYQHQQFQLIEPIGLLYPAGFESEMEIADGSNRDQMMPTSGKVFMVAHQHEMGTKHSQDQPVQGSYCPRHQRPQS